MVSLARRRILIVDDEPNVLQALLLMARTFCEAAGASTAKEARRRFHSDPGLLAVIVDERLPDESGTSLLTHMLTSRPGLAAMLLTGYLERDVVHDGQDLGAEIAIKPLDAPRLKRFLEKAAGGGATVEVPEPVSPQLATCISHIRQLLVRTPVLLERYQNRVACRRGEGDPGRYGANAMTLLSAGVGESTANLYRYARVAEVWSMSEFETIAARRTRDGRDLSWSHLVAIAALESEEARAEYLQIVLDESLSARALTALLVAKANMG